MSYFPWWKEWKSSKLKTDYFEQLERNFDKQLNLAEIDLMKNTRKRQQMENNVVAQTFVKKRATRKASISSSEEGTDEEDINDKDGESVESDEVSREQSLLSQFLDKLTF
ncbi:hypothetical protein BC937DRAFT_86975 [Endogone sp. FLAS-F59071]|nr:hypothetical protein BC937DRAFT_86975 [Endogone sp. FLAS-F59071]|eukprot:RUS23341.1 hypothetical protein BC937DRAFT_86975 [Endogone sp. FLAS-F59071]